MKFTEQIRSIIREANTNHTTPEDATTEALHNVRGMSSYGEMVETLVEHAVHDLVCDDRHTINTRIKYQTGVYFQKAKAEVGESVAVMRAETSVYSYCIAGTSLGEILGKDLLGIASIEDNKADGHIFNSRLMRSLSNVVPQNKTVRRAISNKKLKALFAELQVALKGKRDIEAA